eukprot:9598963-Karenia_brevis.AAC.1
MAWARKRRLASGTRPRAHSNSSSIELRAISSCSSKKALVQRTESVLSTMHWRKKRRTVSSNVKPEARR